MPGEYHNYFFGSNLYLPQIFAVDMVKVKYFGTQAGMASKTCIVTSKLVKIVTLDSKMNAVPYIE